LRPLRVSTRSSRSSRFAGRQAFQNGAEMLVGAIISDESDDCVMCCQTVPEESSRHRLRRRYKLQRALDSSSAHRSRNRR
jgi:hypothetical protein